MTSIEAFRQSLSQEHPPADSDLALEALWWCGKGDWERAHDAATQNQGDPDCDLVHAHLHRQKGELDSAGEWYASSGQPFSQLPLDEEWNQIATRLLAPR